MRAAAAAAAERGERHGSKTLLVKHPPSGLEALMLLVAQPQHDAARLGAAARGSNPMVND